jgi:catechol 2,3-dioxygenase-like lactoylglutathione lyase family enzyme
VARFALEQLDHVAISVRDLPRAIRWYQDALGLTSPRPVTGKEDPPIFLFAGSTAIAFFAASGSDPAPPALYDDGNVAMMHICFRTSREHFEIAHKELEGSGLEVRFEDHGICHSIYFSDPDGYRLEISTYELE